MTLLAPLCVVYHALTWPSTPVDHVPPCALAGRAASHPPDFGMRARQPCFGSPATNTDLGQRKFGSLLTLSLLPASSLSLSPSPSPPHPLVLCAPEDRWRGRRTCSPWARSPRTSFRKTRCPNSSSYSTPRTAYPRNGWCRCRGTYGGVSSPLDAPLLCHRDWPAWQRRYRAKIALRDGAFGSTSSGTSDLPCTCGGAGMPTRSRMVG